MTDSDKRVVAFLGPEGSYTHQAALSAFPQDSTTTPPTTLNPLVTIEDVFAAVQSGSAYRGVVPFENSSNGSVVFTLDLFADIQGKYPDILVCGEAYVKVQHCLLGYSASQTPAQEREGEDGKPRTDLSHIKRLYSHPQAWGQCKVFLDKFLKGVERHDVSSTSKAAEIASKDKTGESAALSSFIAAELFGLDVLTKGINDKLGNTTRFLVIRHRSSPKEDSPAETKKNNTSENGKEGGKEESWKSLITFTVQHSNPGSLAACLTVFSRHGINLTSINTRPSGVQNWDYVFFVEFKGRRRRRGVDGGNHGKEEVEEEGGNECAVDMALKELDKVCVWYRWLGSWENRLG